MWQTLLFIVIIRHFFIKYDSYKVEFPFFSSNLKIDRARNHNRRFFPLSDKSNKQHRIIDIPIAEILLQWTVYRKKLIYHFLLWLQDLIKNPLNAYQKMGLRACKVNIFTKPRSFYVLLNVVHCLLLRA